jgi:hypothetical protein
MAREEGHSAQDGLSDAMNFGEYLRRINIDSRNLKLL